MRKRVVFATVLILGMTAPLTAWWFLFHRAPTRESLIALASDRSKPADARSEAVMRLFAQYVKAGASASEVREALGGCEWIAETDVYAFEFQTGDGHPLWIRESGTLFRLDLFAPLGKSDWIMYVRFSGSGHSITHVKCFFDPRCEPAPDMRLTDFALRCGRAAQWEVFDARGRHPPRDD
jgi:hypothetical protein